MCQCCPLLKHPPSRKTFEDILHEQLGRPHRGTGETGVIFQSNLSHPQFDLQTRLWRGLWGLGEESAWHCARNQGEYLVLKTFALFKNFSISEDTTNAGNVEVQCWSWSNHYCNGWGFEEDARSSRYHRSPKQRCLRLFREGVRKNGGLFQMVRPFCFLCDYVSFPSLLYLCLDFILNLFDNLLTEKYNVK